MNMHYFIGIKVPSHFETHVEELRTTFKLRDAYKIIPAIEDLHVTLSFLGAVADGKISELSTRLLAIAENHSKFSIVVDGIASFGSKVSPRVIYLSIENNRQLNNLHTAISEEVEDVLGKPVDDRFTAHITIAKKWKGLVGFSFTNEKRVPMNVAVPKITLFAIHPNKFPKYEAVRNFSLLCKE